MSRPKTCATCAHRSMWVCRLSGCLMSTERQFPTVCGQDFSGWVQREPLFDRIAFAIWRRPDPLPGITKEGA